MATQPKNADIIDAIHEHIAQIMIMVSLVLACSLAEAYMGEAKLLTYATWALIGIIGLIGLRVLWLFIAKIRGGSARNLEDSFTNHIVHKAATVSWIAGMFAVGMDNRVFSAISVENPLGFMSEAVQAVMFVTYGIAFLYMNHDTGDSDQDVR